MLLKAAKVKDNNFIAEVDHYSHDEKNFHLWWLGQSGYLLLWKGNKILIDPYLSDSLTKKYAGTDKPHTRVSERVVDPRLLSNISIVTSSHNHTDHLDGETLVPLIKNNPAITLVIPEANRDFVCKRIQMPREFPIGLREGKAISVGEFSFHGIPAKHNDIERDDEGNCKFMGYVIRFGNWSIFHSGDTLRYEGMEELLKPFDIDVALLPINGDVPARGVAGNLDAKQAAGLGKAIGAGVVIPCHYDMFAFNTADPKDLEVEAKKIGQPYLILENGGHFSSLFFDQVPKKGKI
jgi:L-ascorbate metabolism protein UlaG (beta-lactamase superfamily)